MTDVHTREGGTARSTPAVGASDRPHAIGPMSFVTVAIGLLFAIPALYVAYQFVTLDSSLGDTVSEIGAPLWRTVQLAILVSGSAAVLGTTLAWLTVRTDLPFRGVWRIVLILPLALPSFVGAGAFIAGIAPGGLIHDTLDTVGITPPRRFRGLGASWLVLTAFTYPYVLLPVSARLMSLRTSLEESARVLGLSSRRAFLRVVLPEIRPAVFAGSLLVFLYTLSEFGAVQLLGYDTLTRLVFATRQADRGLSFAAAAALLVLAIAVVALERRFRGRTDVDQRAVLGQRSARLGWRAFPATALCGIVIMVGLIVPISSLALWAGRGVQNGSIDFESFVEPAMNSAGVAVVTAVIAVVVVLPLAIETTRRPNPLATASAAAVLGGFAIPGLVIALALAVFALNVTGVGWLYQSMALLIVGYVIHFGSQALASTEQAVRAVPTQLREQSRLLEPSAIRRTASVDVPLMRPGLLAGGGLVMLATIKELPATLLLAPPGFTTLATDVWSGFGEGFYAETGMTSLLMITLSGTLTWFLVLRPTRRG